jgi:hypothetical protein
MGTLTVVGSSTGNVTFTTGATAATSIGNISSTQSAANVVNLGTLGATGGSIGNVTIAGAGTSFTMATGAVLNIGDVSASGYTGATNVTLSNTTAIGVNFTGGSGTDTVAGTGGADVINGGEGADVIQGNSGNDQIVLTETTATADDVIFIGAATNGTDTITGFTATDTFRVAALGDGTTGAGLAAITAAAAQGALTDDRSIIISANGTAANLTTGGTATLSTADFTATTLTNVAAYLSERFTITAGAQENVIVFNDTTAGQNLTYIYDLNDAAGNTAIDAAELTLVGIISNGGTDLVNANIDYA